VSEGAPQHVTPARLLALGAAELLAELSYEVESLCSSLCSDAALAARHLAALQAVDLVAQKLCGLAELLAAESPATGLARLRLESLRERFAHLEAYTQADPVGGEGGSGGEVLWN
jgi:hypothetical protein